MQPTAKRRRWRQYVVLLLLGALFGLYAGTYYSWSRASRAEAKQFHMYGFYYYFPENSDSWRQREQLVRTFCAPVNLIDRQFRSEYYPASEPLWGLSR